MRVRTAARGVLAGLLLAGAADGATVTATIRLDPETPAGADGDGRVLLYTPRPLRLGSSHSHFDTSASPNLLMEPFAASDLELFDIDLTRQAMRDLGWRGGSLQVDISYPDAAGEGFSDPTLGAERRAVLEAAAAVWARRLGSSVAVRVRAEFSELPCEEGSGTLASAGPRFVFKDFSGGAPNVWYPGPLAEALSGENLSLEDVADPAAADIAITFNSRIDDGCLGAGSRFYYGLDNILPPGQISFATVALHELGHGLGFVGLVDLGTGGLFLGSPDVFTTLTYDTRREKTWDELTDKQRRQSAKRPREVSFDGRRTTRRARRFLDGSAVVEIAAPDKLAGSYLVGTATFGPPLDDVGLRGDLALVDDDSATPTFGCQPIVNGSEISGKIAVIDRGECLFVEKVRNAQNVGAIAVIIVHNEPGFPPGLGGSDGTIVIPSVRIGQRDGRKIKRELRRGQTR